MMMYGIGGVSQGLMIAFGIGNFLLIALFIYIIYRVIKKVRKNHNPAIEQLRLKYVNGEISEEEYNRKVEFLRK